MYGHVYAKGVCLLPWDCYKTFGLDNACIANTHHSGSIPALHAGQENLCKAVNKLYLTHTAYKTTASDNTVSWHG